MTGPNFNLHGKVALVTGSTRGIGLASAKGLAAMGAKVVVHGRAAADTDKAMSSIRADHPEASLQSVNADLANAAGCNALIDQVPVVDILVNNVGVYIPKPFFEITDEDWQMMMDVNVMSGVRLTRHYLKAMLDADIWGRVVFISSESGIVVPKEMVHYGFSKSAQLMIARGAAETTRGTQVTVNSVLPGPTWVEGQQPRLEARAKEQNTTVDELKKQTFTVRRPTSLLQRYATSEEVANLICYVCSPASSATNGAALRVDGGVVANPF